MDAYSLGQFLRNSREAKDIELADAVAKLRIRQPILEAFEAGDFAATDMSEIQVRGMLRNYARFLGLDEDDTLRLYDSARFGQSRRRRWLWRSERKPERGSRRRRDPPPPMQEIDIEQSRSFHRRRLWSLFVLFVFSSVAIGTIAFVTVQLIGAGGEEDATSGTATADARNPIATEQATEPAPTSAPTVATPTPDLRSRYGGQGVLVNILVKQRNWLRLISDGVEQFAGIAKPETVLEYSAAQEIVLSASSASGLDIEWNGQPQPRTGGRGQRVDMRFSPSDIAVSLGPAGAPTLLSPTLPSVTLPSATLLSETTYVSTRAEMTSPAQTAPPPSATVAIPPTPTRSPSATPTASQSPTITTIPTITLTPTGTAILPPRVTQTGFIAKT